MKINNFSWIQKEVRLQTSLLPQRKAVRSAHVEQNLPFTGDGTGGNLIWTKCWRLNMAGVRISWGPTFSWVLPPGTPSGSPHEKPRKKKSPHVSGGEGGGDHLEISPEHSPGKGLLCSEADFTRNSSQLGKGISPLQPCQSPVSPKQEGEREGHM